MFENEAKGWFGSYSLAGKNSAEKYHSIVHKEEILGNEYRKIKAKDIFSPDDSIALETIDDNFDIFKVYSPSMVSMKYLQCWRRRTFSSLMSSFSR